MQKPTVLDVTTRTKSRFFVIEAVRLLFSNGKEREFERIATTPVPATVCIVALTAEKEVLLVREYAAGVDRYEWTLPSGSIEPGESTEQAAIRELMEETGYAATHVETIGRLALAPSICGYEVEIALARALYPCRLQGDEPENLDCARCPLEGIVGPRGQPVVQDARTLAAILVATDFLTRNT
ncbi:MAG: ADP compounds hydrolase NudE, partial [Phycisphaerales bacterium]|nr:ADP compounds hydrolase NudE [Phycisphaerales bacterium]